MFDRELELVRREIGTRVKTRRKMLGLTQTELAHALGHTTCQRINQIELGRRRLYAEELPRLCKALNCSISDVIFESDCPGS
jgi:transcriptional regulator with XRE-family HTH domain